MARLNPSQLYVALVILCCTLWGSLAWAEPVSLPRSEQLVIKDTGSQREYPIWIQVPKSYASSPQRHYPVVYLADANYSFAVVAGGLRLPMNAGKMQEVILVAMGYETGSKGQDSRVRDYTPIRDPQWRRETGNASGYTAFIQRDLMSYITANYRVLEGQNTFVGHSLGGLLGAHILAHQPALFSSYVLSSPSAWYANNHILDAEFNHVPQGTRVWVSVGERETPAFGLRHDMVDGAQQLAAKLASIKSIEVSLSVIPLATHETAFPSIATQALATRYSQSSSHAGN